jgi:DNA-directed RNA polymerase specialized sigma24 family protein
MSRFPSNLDSVQETVAVEDDLEENERIHTEFHAMDKAIASLGEPCKSLLEAYYLEKKSMTDIALSFGYTNAENAKNQKYKCLVRLKKIFFAQYKNGNGNG